MLCKLDVRLDTPDEEGLSHCLRITGITALGPSGTGGRDQGRFVSKEALIDMLDNLSVPEAVIDQATDRMHSKDYGPNFVTVGNEVQIAFEDLERCGFYLFDQ